MTRDRSAEAFTVPVRHEALVVENRHDGGVHRRLRLRAPGWEDTAPGQFAMLSPGVLADAPRWDPLLPRPMAVFRTLGAGSDREVEFLYKVVGRGTALLAQARPGDRVRAVGPLGRAFPDPPDGARMLLVGGGTGVASLYGLARKGAARGSVSVLLGASSREDLMGLADFEALEVELRVSTDDGSRGQRGLVTDLLEVAVAPGATVYACGPTPMMRRCAEIAASAGVPCFVSLENTMACGIGICLGCAAPRRDGSYALVCRDGPVFEAERVAWEGLP